MATSRASHLKEKVASPSSSPSTVGRKSPRPPGSPNRLPSTTPDKPTTHNYLKSKSSISATKSSAPKSTTIAKSTIKKSTDVKPPSPARRPERTLSAPKPRSPSPSPLPRPSKATNSHALDRRGPKSLTKSSSTISGRTARNNPLTRSKSLEKRKEIVATPSAFVDKSETSNNKDEVEAVEEQDHNNDVAAQKTNNVEEHEGKQADILIIDHENENEHEMVNDEAVAEETKQDEATEAVAVEESPKRAEPEPQPETEEHVQSAEAPATVAARSVVSSKKEAHLSNDVIEEAKSKFLEKRKNKVLALVGAFETVMALQEPDGQQHTQQLKKDKEVDEGNSNANESTEST